ncbi:DUF3945 domain-containing protein [Adhaeribacter aquaticus]|uniref:DUF3945 domain-containing protein n=1 Tax=Adhaeribacter aquaticus TaxID=299567 RepID=UPI0004220629|nr:DUF3945 domain-containing protein [Adhaeribacter aquaticus]
MAELNTTLTPALENPNQLVKDIPNKELAQQREKALEIGIKLFPENKFTVINTEADISGGYNFQLQTNKEGNHYPNLKPGFKQPREIERQIEKLNTIKILFDHELEKVKVSFDDLGTLKYFSYKQLNFRQDNPSKQDLTQSTEFNYKGYKIERSYESTERSPYRVTDASGKEIGTGEAAIFSQELKERGKDDRQMPYFKTDAEIKKEVDNLLIQNDEKVRNEPQNLFTVNKETGEINIIGKDETGKPVLKKPEDLKNEQLPLLEVIPHKGFLGNFILNFKNHYNRNNLEILAAPISKPIAETFQELKQHLPGIKAGFLSALDSLNEKTGITGIANQSERDFLHLPEKEQQKLLQKFADESEGNHAFTLKQKKGYWEMPEEELPKTSFLTDVKNFIRLLKDQEIILPSTADPKNTTTQITRFQKLNNMQQPRFNLDDINWKDAEKLGLTRNLLEQTGNLERLLNGEKTHLITGMKGDLGGVKVSLDGKFRLVENPQGQPTLVFHGVKAELTVPKSYLGYEFSEEDKQALKEKGNLGKKVELIDRTTNSSFKGYIGVDKDTKEIVAVRAERIKIPNELKGVLLSDEQKKSLEEGNPTAIAGMKDDKNQEFSATVQIDPAKKGFSFRPLPDTAIKETVKPENKIQVAANNDGNKAETVKNLDTVKSKQQEEPKQQSNGRKKGGPKL